MELRKYTYRQFSELSGSNLEDYFTIFRHLNPQPFLGEKGKPVHELSFIDVRSMMDYFSGKRTMTFDVVVWMVALVSQAERDRVWSSNVFTVMAVYNHCRASIDRLITYENNIFTDGGMSSREAMAGAGELQQFGIYNELDILSGGVAVHWEQAMQIPYYLAVKKLHKDFISSQVEKRLK